jgi:hypothetical protein
MKATLAGVGFYDDAKKNPGIVDSLVQYLAGLKGGAPGDRVGAPAGAPAAPAVVMPNFNLNDDELQNVVIFLLGLQESTVSWPQKSFAPSTAGDPQAKAVRNWSNSPGATLVMSSTVLRVWWARVYGILEHGQIENTSVSPFWIRIKSSFLGIRQK